MRAIGLDKGGLELAHRLDGRITLDAVLCVRSIVGNDFVLIESIVVGGLGQCVGSHRELVLVLARYAEFRRQLVRADSHYLSSCVVGNGWCLEAQIFRFEALAHVSDGPHGTALLHGLWEGDEFLSNRSRQTNWHVGKGFNAARDDDIGVSGLDCRCTGGNGGVGRNAGLRNRVAGNVVWQTGVDRCLPGNVGSFDFLDDVAADDVINNIFGQGRLVNQALDGEALQVNGHFVLVYRGSLGKGQSHTADNNDITTIVDGSRRKSASDGGRRIPASKMSQRLGGLGKHGDFLVLLMVQKERKKLLW